MAKKTIFRLEFESEFHLVGLFCNESDYRLIWLLNRYLLYNFARVEDFRFTPHKSNNTEHFSVFHYNDEQFRREFFVVNNRSYESRAMFAQPSGLDYIMLIRAGDSRFDFDTLLKNLRTIAQFTAAYQIDDHLAKGREAFLYDFEMFVDKVVEGPKKRQGLFWSVG